MRKSKGSEKMDIQWMTVDKLYEICGNLRKENKGDYRVYLATGGYYDGYVDNFIISDDDDKELILSTP